MGIKKGPGQGSGALQKHLNHFLFGSSQPADGLHECPEMNSTDLTPAVRGTCLEGLVLGESS